MGSFAIFMFRLGELRDEGMACANVALSDSSLGCINIEGLVLIMMVLSS